MRIFKSAELSPVCAWLGLGVIMLLVQILLGGVTRLTGSGLSITEWQPLIGALPPLDHGEWQQSFSRYQQIAQFKKLNYRFTLADYQGLFFWEWLHREWARLMGLAFSIPFMVFMWQKRFSKRLSWQLTGLFVLSAIQGFAGWLMVKSGLNETDVTVSHIRLAVHFMLALGLLVYLYGIFLSLNQVAKPFYTSKAFQRISRLIITVLALQLVYGAFMAGTHAVLFAPTWPAINDDFFVFSPGITGNIFYRMTYDPFLIQFMHRLLAYLLSCLFLSLFLLSRRSASGKHFQALTAFPLVLLIIQVLLGIGCLLHAVSPYYSWLAAIHQLNGILLLLSMVRVVCRSSSRLVPDA